MWSVPRSWPGQTIFIAAGGPSLTRETAKHLHGRHVIAINSAWNIVPEADYVFFADARWWRQFKPKFMGVGVTTSDLKLPGIMRLNKVEPFALSPDPHCVALRKTSVTGAINLAVHLGATRIVLLGVDGKLSPEGRRHNHSDRYPWPIKRGCFDDHAAEFAKIAPSARKMGVEIVNANPDSAINVWPKHSLQDCLCLTA